MEKIKAWRTDGFLCILVNDGLCSATVSLDAIEIAKFLADIKADGPDEDLAQLLAIALCCGKTRCDAANRCSDYGISPDTYARSRGCESDDAIKEVLAAIEKLRR